MATLVIAAAFVFAIHSSFGWRELVAKFPLSMAIPGLALAALVLVQDAFEIRRWRAAGAVEMADPTMSGDGMTRGLRFVAVQLVTLVAGQLAALVLFTVTYLVVWGGYGWPLVAPYAAGVLGFIYLMFEWIVPVVWYRPLLTFLGTG